MKNEEKFKNEITDIICDGKSIAVDKETRVPKLNGLIKNIKSLL